MFAHASELDPLHPLPYANAARTYQQLNQTQAAERHLQKALALDSSLALIRVDMAQHMSLSGRASEALHLLDEALTLARHVSEIKDVLTARAIISMSLDLEARGIISLATFAPLQP